MSARRRNRPVSQKRIAEALGSSKVSPIRGGRSCGPVDLLALRAEARRRLQSSGGRPSDPAWDLTRQVPFKAADWKALEELAAAISTEDRSLSAGQLAAILIERGLSELRHAK